MIRRLVVRSFERWHHDGLQVRRQHPFSAVFGGVVRELPRKPDPDGLRRLAGMVGAIVSMCPAARFPLPR